MIWRAQLAICLLLSALTGGDPRYHYSSWSDDPEPYREAIRKTEAAPPLNLAAGERICAGIVTHHFLASGMMVRFFAGLQAQTSPQTIILIGPNHFHHGLANVSVSSLPWKTPFGIVETNTQIVERIKAAANLPEDSDAFAGEHSVGVLMPFVRYYFPHARIVPILIDVNAKENALRALRGLMSGYLADSNILVLLSMDFSHNSLASISDARDAQAQQALSTLDLDKTEGLNVDCRKGLWLLLASLRNSGPVRVRITGHTNSARLTGNPQQPDVTSYFSVLFLRR